MIELARAFRARLDEGREDLAWEAAVTLAKSVLEHRAVVLATAVLDAGPFALKRAMELAEMFSPEETMRPFVSAPARRR